MGQKEARFRAVIVSVMGSLVLVGIGVDVAARSDFFANFETYDDVGDNGWADIFALTGLLTTLVVAGICRMSVRGTVALLFTTASPAIATVGHNLWALLSLITGGVFTALDNRFFIWNYRHEDRP